MVINNHANYSSAEQGYIYLWTLFAVALAGVALAGVGPMWQIESQQEKERELLFVGDQFRRAIESYYNNSSGKAKRYPESLEQLLEDRSSLVIRRHLRKVFLDPMTNGFDWGLIKQSDTGITGVYSQSTGIPIKRANFPEHYSAFSEAKSYKDWKFVHAGGAASGTGSRQSKTPKSGSSNTAPTNPFASGQAPAGPSPFSQNQPASGANPFTQNPE
jgi:type II secretory pathway pseudopilin PulG